MKIDHHQGLTPSTAPAAVAQVRTGTDEAAAAFSQPGVPVAGGQTPDSTSVKLSATASSLLAASTPEFDSAKVEKMRQAIADGSFRADPGAIADKLISNAQELLSKRSH
ncbi:MAG: flagellar biosynthesis anti-sigma factor FlgM [Proteobacteria bacterium]|nr:flagellar biosynthesis anti-sigma factor FlgM [Pseudomonadota bacterium]